MSKLDQVNELIKINLAEAISREIGIPNALVTITFVECSPDFKYARVGFSVLPENLTGTTLRTLQKNSSNLAGILAKKTKLRRLPHFNWVFDATEKEASKLERYIATMEEELLED